MHQLLHDYFWIYNVVIVVLCGAVFYFTPKLVMKFLSKGVEEKQVRRVKKKEPDETAEKNRSRYKTF